MSVLARGKKEIQVNRLLFFNEKKRMLFCRHNFRDVKDKLSKKCWMHKSILVKECLNNMINVSLWYFAIHLYGSLYI